MKSAKVRVYIEDELPRIGAGWRTVLVKVGRKYVYFLNPCTGSRQRLPKTKAEPIIRSVLPLTK